MMNIKCSPFISFYLSLSEKEGEKKEKGQYICDSSTQN